MSSTVMASDYSPPPSPTSHQVSCTVISEVHPADISPTNERTDYSSAGTLKLPHHSHSYSDDDNKSMNPHVEFIDPTCDVITSPPHARDLEEDEIAVSVSTQTDEESCKQTESVISSDCELLESRENKKENECGLTCLYFTLQCCDCVVM